MQGIVRRTFVDQKFTIVNIAMAHQVGEQTRLFLREFRSQGRADHQVRRFLHIAALVNSARNRTRIEC